MLKQYFSPICGTCRRLKKLYGLPGYLLPYTLSWVAGALNGGQIVCTSKPNYFHLIVIFCGSFWVLVISNARTKGGKQK